VNILITGICGYVGSSIARRFIELQVPVSIIGIDNLSRRGSETNLKSLKRLGVQIYHGDLRLASDLGPLPAVDWVVDCAANPTVIAGTGHSTGCTSRQLVDHNLIGTINLLEFCRERDAGLVLLSTSRVYSIRALSELPLCEMESRYEVASTSASNLKGFSECGINEDFPTDAPISLYGATKLASESLALEYGEAFGFPVWINRCGVIGGPGQLGKIDQGIFAFWVYSCILGRPLRYIGFDGSGKQVRDCVLAEDVADLIARQICDPKRPVPRLANVGGGRAGALSLLELTRLCENHLGRPVDVASSDETRPYDIPYFVTDAQRVRHAWDWQPSQGAEEIVQNLCDWTMQNLQFVRSLFD
jgi:CDP-paratose 2-epimerase